MTVTGHVDDALSTAADDVRLSQMPSLGSVLVRVRREVYRHVYRHAHRHVRPVCRYVYGHVCRLCTDMCIDMLVMHHEARLLARPRTHFPFGPLRVAPAAALLQHLSDRNEFVVITNMLPSAMDGCIERRTA